MQLITPKVKDLGGFSVRRVMPQHRLHHVGPWLFFDHMGPANFAPGEGINVRPHPHTHMATVTYLYEGEILHQDDLGNVISIESGDINLMIAGSGIVHSERERAEIHQAPHRAHGLQLWLGLPEADEMMDAEFHHYQAGVLPAVTLEGVVIRLLIGEAYGAESPVKTLSPTLYFEARLQAGAELALPEAAERAVYVVAGSIRYGDAEVSEGHMLLLNADEKDKVHANAETMLAVIGGEPLGKRYIDWNFVGSSLAQLSAARERWIAGEFAEIPTDNQEFIPYPTRKASTDNSSE